MTLLLALLASTGAPDRVVVFPDRAQVTRVAQLDCGARVHVTFENIPPAAAGESFRARLGGGTIDGLRAELVDQARAYAPQAAAMIEQQQQLERERTALNDQLGRARTQAMLGVRYTDLAAQFVSREMAGEKPDVKAWQLAFDSALLTGIQSAKLAADTEAKLRVVEHRLGEVAFRLDGLRVAQSRKAWTVEVLASCSPGSRAELALTYLVGGASWTPSYEARADEAANVVDLSTWATIVQATGEDWSNVALTLSTAVPTQNATPPDMKKLLVQGYEKPPEKKVLVRREEFVAHAQSAPSDSPAPASNPVARNQGLSVQLIVPEQAKVPGNGSPVRLFVGKTRMKAKFELRALPKLVPVAFRAAELANQAPWPLLPGRVDSFRSTGLVGRYPLERVAQGAAFTLTFGVEDSVRVKRTVVEELKRDQGLFNDKKRFTYAYRFELANYGRSAIEVALADHLPVSELDDISVTVGEKTTRGYQLDSADGIARWVVSIKPGERKSVDFAFRVEVPTSYDMGGL